MKTLLVTGGIGSGKSRVCGFLAEKGIPVYDADSRTKALYEGPLLTRVEEAFHQSFSTPDGRPDFAALGRAAFASAESLLLLESIVHPAVLADFSDWKKACSGAPFLVLESAIALEKPLFDGSYDAVVLVYSPEKDRIARIRHRNPALSEEDIRLRLAAQRFDFTRADYLLINDASLDALRSQVDALFNHLSS